MRPFDYYIILRLQLVIVIRGKMPKKANFSFFTNPARQCCINLSTYFSYIVAVLDETGIFADPLVLFTIRGCGKTQTPYVTEACIAAV